MSASARSTPGSEATKARHPGRTLAVLVLQDLLLALQAADLGGGCL